MDSDLTDAPTFDSLRDSIGRWLQPDVIFVGHNLGFDFSMLRREFEASGSPLTTLTGLDTMTLAAAAGIAAGRISLSELLERLGLANSAEHTAVGDALATAQAVIALLGLLVDQGRTSIDDLTFTTDSVLVRELSEQEVQELLPDTPEHHASHSQPMMLPEQRQEALDYCLSVGCTILLRRMQDARAGPEARPGVSCWARCAPYAWSRTQKKPRSPPRHPRLSTADKPDGIGLFLKSPAPACRRSVGGGRGSVHVAGTEARSSARVTCSWPPSAPGPRPPMVAYRLRQGPPQCWRQHRRRSDCTRHGWFHFSAPGAERHKTLAGDRRGPAEGRRVDSKELVVQPGSSCSLPAGPGEPDRVVLGVA